MITKGLPDFGVSIVLADGPVWACGFQGLWLAPATGLGLAQDAAGIPTFRVTLARPSAPFLPPEPFGGLDFTVRAERNLETALQNLRAVQPGATLASALPTSGTLRLGEVPGSPTLPTELGTSSDLVWAEPERARFVRRLSIESAGLLEGMLSDGLLPVQVTGALGFDGLSPRLPITLRFDPEALLAALSTETGPETRDTLVSRIKAMLSDLPLGMEPQPDHDQRTAVAEAMADRLVSRFGTSSGETTAGVPQFSLQTDAGFGHFTWDLAVPFLATRWITLETDPFEALRTFLSAHGSAALVDRRTLSPLPVGTRLVRAAASLPTDSAGVEALGLTLTAPPWPPHRPRPAIATAILTPPVLEADLRLRLAPGEPLQYDVACFSVLADALGVRRIEGPVRRVSDAVTTLSPLDFGLECLVLEASPSLLTLMTVDGEIHSTVNGQAQKLRITLDTDQPRVSFAVTSTVEDGQILLQATSIEDGATIDLEPLPLQGLRVDLALFPGYGPQTAQISVDIPATGAVVGIDVIAASAPEDTMPETLAFREGRNAQTWQYLSRSPFNPGFKWRKMDTGGGPGPWQHHTDPAQPLHLSS